MPCPTSSSTETPSGADHAPRAARRSAIRSCWIVGRGRTSSPAAWRARASRRSARRRTPRFRRARVPRAPRERASRDELDSSWRRERPPRPASGGRPRPEIPVGLAERCGPTARRVDDDASSPAGASSRRPSWPGFAAPAGCRGRHPRRRRDAAPGASRDGDRLMLGGEPLTAEMCGRRSAMPAASTARRARRIIVASRLAGVRPRARAAARCPPGLPIVIDLWPCDDESGCWADMTRTFVVGEIRDEVRAWRRSCARRWTAPARRPARGSPAASCTTRRAMCSRRPATAPSAPARATTRRRVSVLARPRRRAGGPRGAVARPGRGEPAGGRRRGGRRARALAARRRRRAVEDLLLVTEDGCEMLTDTRTT